jgi:mono/diheme cytochrome c family protein
MKVLGSGLLATFLIAAAQEEEIRSVQSGVYTDEQAERGLKVFEGTCIACHQPEEFSDGGYIDGWSGQMAHDMIEHIRETMPQDTPGSLKRAEYVDVAAFFFRLNGLPTGDTEMDVESVKKIRIEGPYQPPSR